MSTGTVEPHDSASGSEPDSGAESLHPDSPGSSAKPGSPMERDHPADSDKSAEAADPANSGSPAKPGSPAGRDYAAHVDNPANPSGVDPAARTAVRTLGGWMVLRGALGVLFGLAMVFWPREQLGSPANLGIPVATVDNLLIAYLVAAGILVFLHGLRTRGDLRTPLLGEAVVVVPALVFLLLAENSGQLRAAVAVWALLHGAIELWIWVLQRGQHMRSDFLISSAVHIALGLIVLLTPNMGALTVFGFTGAAALIVGVLFLVGGYSRRSRMLAGAASPEPRQVGRPGESDSGGAPGGRPDAPPRDA